MTAPDKLAGIKPGDTVEVTFRGVVSHLNLHNGIRVENGKSFWWAEPDSGYDIKRIEPDLKVGDRVAIPDRFLSLTVKAIEGDVAWLWAGGEPWGSRPVCDLRRIP